MVFAGGVASRAQRDLETLSPAAFSRKPPPGYLVNSIFEGLLYGASGGLFDRGGCGFVGWLTVAVTMEFRVVYSFLFSSSSAML